MKLLDTIKTRDDILKLNEKQLNELCAELREFMLENVSKTGGHPASNLGVVELTVALNRVFDTSVDRVIWDVGHQTYIHKILSGRKESFDTLRSFGGLSGFPKRSESIHDAFNTGHSSTSISAALGMARGRDMNGEDHKIVAVIGDGALTGGMAYEALNDAGSYEGQLMVILNDNGMSIAQNTGALSCSLGKMRLNRGYQKNKAAIKKFLLQCRIGRWLNDAISRTFSLIKFAFIKGAFFESFGFKYLGPIDGHDIAEMTEAFSIAAKQNMPVIVHVSTHKGHGYKYAEKNPDRFHGIESFNVKTGEPLSVSTGKSWSEVFGDELCKVAASDPKVIAVTAAMKQGTGLCTFGDIFPERFFDVSIAEQHAVTMAAGIAATGNRPVVAIYSTFLQRAYDQILHDVGLQNLHVVFAIDRAGLVGKDGETHQGLYDVSYLRHVPNMTILAPSCKNIFGTILEYAIEECTGPVAVRYPRGICSDCDKYDTEAAAVALKSRKALICSAGSSATVVAFGESLKKAFTVKEMLAQKGFEAEIIDPIYTQPLDYDTIISSAQKTGRLYLIEDTVYTGSAAEGAAAYMKLKNINTPCRIFTYKDVPITHGSTEDIEKLFGLDADNIYATILSDLEGK